MTSESRPRVLVIDDDRFFCLAVRETLDTVASTVAIEHTGATGLARCERESFDVILLDQKLPDGSGEDLCRRLMELNDLSKVVLVTAFPSLPTAVEAIKQGAYDYLAKPVSPEKLKLLVLRAADAVSLARSSRLLSLQDRRTQRKWGLVGSAPCWVSVLREVELAQRSQAPVLITGETGTGKSVLARAIARGRAPFVDVNCAALPESLIENELFGHERGAFTGATTSQPGLFELAHGGTLFLDEIGEMPAAMQAKLLGVLDSGTVRRIGGRKTFHVDVRILAASNVRIEDAIQTGRFRMDLFYRLSVMQVHLPPLRDRPEDIPALCDHFLKQIGGASEVVTLAPGEVERLQSYRWPGNVRELRNLLERAYLVRAGPALTPSAHLPHPERAGQGARAPAISDAETAPPIGEEIAELHPEDEILTLEEVKRRHVRRTLQRFNGNVTRTARALGVSRSTIQRLVRTWALGNPAANCSTVDSESPSQSKAPSSAPS